jgi:hypothetical protein
LATTADTGKPIPSVSAQILPVSLSFMQDAAEPSQAAKTLSICCAKSFAASAFAA